MDPVLSRRSVREYTDQPVSEETVRTLLKAAMVASSAEDQRPWHFVVIRDQEIRAKIPQVHRFAYMVSRAPVALLICGDETRQKQRGFWVQDCAAATENILIEAQQLGLGAVWLGVYPIEGRVQGFRRLLNIPDHVVPFALVIVGYPAERKKPVDRYDASRVHRDRWEDPGCGELDETLTHVPVSGTQTVERASEQSQVDGFGDAVNRRMRPNTTISQ